MRHRVNKCNGDFAPTIRLWGSAIIVGKREIAVRAGSDLANRLRRLSFATGPFFTGRNPLSHQMAQTVVLAALGTFVTIHSSLLGGD